MKKVLYSKGLSSIKGRHIYHLHLKYFILTMLKSSNYNSQSKIPFIDLLKVILTVLVIIHHAAITYGAPGDWYYSQKTTLPWVKLLLTGLVAVNQSFFMGFFFFLSALFIPFSYDKKGPQKFLLDRLIRLGVPLVFYSLILSPFLSFIPYNYTNTHPKITYLQYLNGFASWISFGVLWFVLALLLFTILYVIFKLIRADLKLKIAFPNTRWILLFATLIGLITYFVRLAYPVGWVLQPFGFQLGHFPQYIAMFILGIIASKNNWLDKLNPQTGKAMLILSLGLALIGFPLFIIVQKWLLFPVGEFNIGGHWPSLWYAVWEQLTGFCLVTTLLCFGKSKWNAANRIIALVSRTTFAMYIFHPLFLIGVTVVVNNLQIEPGLKFLITTPLSILITFLIARCIIFIPGVNKVV